MKPHRFVSVGMVLMSVLLTGRLFAQPTNGVVTFTEDTFTAAGGSLGAGNPATLLTAIGLSSGGTVTNGTFTLHVGYPTTTITRASGTRTIVVEGTVNESNTSVMVNGITASVTGTTFRAEGVTLVEGPNTLTATATDPAGNSAGTSVTVYLNTQPPARPTVAATPAVTTDTSYTLTGTKTPQTSLWMNDVEIVSLNEATTWSTTVSLQEGDNVFVVVAKNAAGNASASNTVNIVVDNLPPVITVTLPARTNLNPYPLTGTVDDSLTTVVVNGITADRSARTLTAHVPLVEGANTVTITATSPNGYVATKTFSITLGTLPVILSLQPTDGTKVYAGKPVTMQATASDKEHDPIQYQLLLDGQVLVDWTSTLAASWTPTIAQLGKHTLEFRVRDDVDGVATQTSEVWVLRLPVEPPS